MIQNSIHLFLQLQAMISLIFFSIISLSNAISFNYSGSGYDSITLTNERVSVKNSQGMTRYNVRLTYPDPLHLWDKDSGNLSDFNTYFTFILDTSNQTSYGDGLVFFLAPNGTRIPDNITEGGAFGLTSDQRVLNSTESPFVAVEFDVYSNPWDPPGTHVGVDINSMRSLANTSWLRSVTNEVWITYNSTSYNLSVVVRGYRNETQETQYVSHMVDLRSWLPQWVTFGFSASVYDESSVNIDSWTFSSDLVIDTKSATRRQENQMGIVIGALAGGCLLVIGLAGFLLWRKSKRDREYEDLFHQYIGQEFSSGTGPKKFSYGDLSKATNNFRPEQKLGEGGFGGVYRGFLKNTNTHIAVKRISSSSKQGIKEYASEIKIISKLRHRNLVQLLGWCHEKRELLLVYEFMPNRSLDFHLFEEQHSLPWEKRYRIAQGLAAALLYLQEEWEQCVLHRDIKSSNVMLDSEFTAKLGDFGLARLVDHAKGSRTTILAGTKGYMAPECATSYRVTKESDVYSFGIVSLEIACGRRAVDFSAEEDRVVLVEWVRELYGMRNILQSADPKLLEEFDEREMMRLLIVGLWCAHPEGRQRPSMKQVYSILDFDAPLPDFPASFLTATYYDPSMNAAQLNSLSSTEASEEDQQVMLIKTSFI